MLQRTKIRRKLRFMYSRLREWRMIAKGLLSTRHPVLAHIIPIRRCNLSCAYCNEYDDHSAPVPVEEMYRRIDRLASFGTTIITISGGGPPPQPELHLLIRRIRQNSIIPGVITNRYLLTSHRTQGLKS